MITVTPKYTVKFSMKKTPMTKSWLSKFKKTWQQKTKSWQQKTKSWAKQSS